MISFSKLSIRHYAFLFAGLTLMMFIVFGLFTYHEVEAFRDEVDTTSRVAAQRELLEGLEKVLDQTYAISRRFGDWDEVHQQLQYPGYYAYWQNHRMRSANVLPEDVLHAEIYHPDGSMLSVTPNALLPHHIDPDDHDPYIDLKDGKSALILFERIKSKEEGKATIGFVGLRITFMPLLLQLNQFQYLDSDTIQFAPTPDDLILVEDFIKTITFEPRKNPATDAVETVLDSAIFKLGLVVGILSLLFYPMLVYLIGKPLQRLSQHIDHLKGSPGGVLLDQLKYHLPVWELEKVRLSLNEYQTQLVNVHNSLDEKNRELWDQAHHDPLTGVLNRRAFDDFWHQMNEMLVDRRLCVCLILFDVNHFKAINDTYGHQVGDEVLKGIVTSINGVLRKGEHLYRLGGDELATVLIDSEKESALKLAKRCEKAISNYPFSDLGIKEPIKVSVGLALADASSGDELGSLLWKADMAMYNAKRPGQSHVMFFSEEMANDAGSLFSSWINNAVFEAINEGTGLTIFYQPIVDLKHDVVAYYEALVRIHYEDEWILPGSIFPLVEARRLEAEFDRAVLAKILLDLDANCIPAGKGISINLSGPMVINEKIIEWLAPYQAYMENYQFTLEVTETTLITQLSKATEHLLELRKMGFAVALDDFGSGYSSVRYLASMPVDLVKFDISLIRCLADEAQRSIIQHLAQMIIESGYRLVAEGIEAAELREQVIGLGFHYGQGYLFGKPERLLSTPSGRGKVRGMGGY
ncbi:MAG: bifunctional diguanylate cyclase/phosphodiesterase [Candidatus Sedimenticola sp. (ex Thyasira tokunagai)]